jgi:hypothetical protein
MILGQSAAMAVVDKVPAQQAAPCSAQGEISPTSGSTVDGTSVTITGTNFTGATGVTFGGVAASFSVVNVTTIQATTPAHMVGAVSIVVTTGSGSNTANTLYTFVTPPPTVNSVSPSSGSTLGGTVVTLTGTVFTGATAVIFGGRPAASYCVVNSTTITATTPASEQATVSVNVTTPNGSNTANALFAFNTPTPTTAALSSSQPTIVFLSPPTFTAQATTIIGGAPVPGQIALYIDDVLLESKAVDG